MKPEKLTLSAWVDRTTQSCSHTQNLLQRWQGLPMYMLWCIMCIITVQQGMRTTDDDVKNNLCPVVWI